MHFFWSLSLNQLVVEDSGLNILNFFSWMGEICDVAYQQSTKQMLIPSFMPMSCMRTRTNLLLLSRARTRTHKTKDIVIVLNVNSKSEDLVYRFVLFCQDSFTNSFDHVQGFVFFSYELFIRKIVKTQFQAKLKYYNQI